MVLKTFQPPVLKVGAVVIHPEDSRILIVQPKPKHAGEVPPFVLPRGSRQYSVATQDGGVEWRDARDAETGVAHAASLEPMRRALVREISEEAGVSARQLETSKVTELGALPFYSRANGTYPIHWFVVEPDKATAKTLAQQLPEDALAVRWANVDAIKDMAVKGEFSAGYVPVIEAALSRIQSAAAAPARRNAGRGRA